MAVIVVSYVLDRYMFRNKSESGRLCSEVWKMTECNYTQERFQDALKKFKKMISQADADELKKINYTTEDGRKDAIKTAVKLAYGDAKRTMQGIDEKDREKAIKAVTEKFFYYLFPTSKSQPPAIPEKFDYFHNDMCTTWSECFSHSSFSSLKAYGKAQKIVNMTFKYLYCYTDTALKGFFEHCHMPLDSFTLEWFKREMRVKHNLIVGQISSWSKMENEDGDTYKDQKDDKKYSYHFYVSHIRRYIKDNKIELTPLQLEFIIWPETQLNLATENFLFALHDNYDDEEDTKTRKEYNKEIRSLDLDEKIKKVKEKIDNLYL